MEYLLDFLKFIQTSFPTKLKKWITPGEVIFELDEALFIIIYSCNEQGSKESPMGVPDIGILYVFKK